MQEEQTTGQIEIEASRLKRFCESVYSIIGNNPATCTIDVENNKLFASIKNIDSTIAGIIEEIDVRAQGDTIDFGVINYQTLVSSARAFKGSDMVKLCASSGPNGKGFVVSSGKSKFNNTFASESACALTSSPGKFKSLDPIYTITMNNDTLSDVIRGSKISKAGFDKAVFITDGTIKLINTGVRSNYTYGLSDDEVDGVCDLTERPILIKHLKNALNVLKSYGEGCKIKIFEVDRCIGLEAPGLNMVCATMMEAQYQ